MEAHTLERLIAPISVPQFFAEYWERQPLLVKRGQRHYFDGLLTLEDVDRAITTLNLHHPAISMTDARRSVQVDEYTYETGLIDVARLYQQYRDGATIILQQLDQSVPTLGQLCRAMERSLSTRFQTNIYVTRADAQGFKPHYDSHDVFVLQLHGSKSWSLYNTPIELPYRRQEFRPSEVAVGAETRKIELEAGDLLYLPRGMMHDARATSEMSMHVTLGVLFTSWTDVLAEALGRVGLADVDFRRSLPPGFANPGYDRTEARATFRRLLDKLAAAADADGALDHFADDLIRSRQAILPGQMAQIHALPTLGADTVFTARPDVLYRLETSPTDAASVVLHCYGGALRFPVHARVPLEAVLTARAPFTLRDLPGRLDEAGRLVLMRRLVAEGLAFAAV